MNPYEDNLIILLRKIVALALPKTFDAGEDTYRQILLEKLRIQDNELFLICDDFVIAFESREFIRSDYQLKLKAHDIWQSQYQMFNHTLDNRSASIKQICKKRHIDIDYELEKLFE